MARGHFRNLVELIVARNCKPGAAWPNMPLSYVVPLAASISVGDLDGLHRLHVEWEEEGILVLLHALREGACPQLRTLGNILRRPQLGDAF